MKLEKDRQTKAEQQSTTQLRLQELARRDNIRLNEARLQDTARFNEGMFRLADRFIASQDERERRQGEFQERLLGLQKVGGQSDNREILEELRSLNRTISELGDPVQQQQTRDKIYDSLIRETSRQQRAQRETTPDILGSPRFVELPRDERDNPLNQAVEPEETSRPPPHRRPPPESAPVGGSLAQYVAQQTRQEQQVPDLPPQQRKAERRGTPPPPPRTFGASPQFEEETPAANPIPDLSLGASVEVQPAFLQQKAVETGGADGEGRPCYTCRRIA